MITIRSMVVSVARAALPLACVAVFQFAIPATAAAADSPLAAPICTTLKKVLPEVKTFKPEAARAQLVMALADQFEYDGPKLRQVRTEIDKVASASCPKERDSILPILKTKSLAEALR